MDILEQRLTFEWKGWTIRCWIPLDWGDDQWRKETILSHFTEGCEYLKLMTANELAIDLAETFGMNSCEVCDSDGNGFAFHRDWP